MIYLLPIVLDSIGGLIMFFVIKDGDRQTAKNGVVIGAIVSVVVLILIISAGSN